MVVQNDLDLAIRQLEGLSPTALSLYAYAAYKLLCKKIPLEVNSGSFNVFISDTPFYSKSLEHEVSMDLNVKITVVETLTSPDY